MSDSDIKGYYKTLKLEPGTTIEAVRKAYKKLVVTAHPDKGGDVEEFKKIQEAYSILSDEKKKELYDQGIDSDTSDIGGFPFGGFPFSGSPFGGFQQMKQETISVPLTLKQMYNGCKVPVKVGEKQVELDIPKGILHKQALKVRIVDTIVTIIVKQDNSDNRVEEGDTFYHRWMVDEDGDLKYYQKISDIKLPFVIEHLDGSKLKIDVRPKKLKPFDVKRVEGRGWNGEHALIIIFV